jgi:hypothetical protein
MVVQDVRPAIFADVPVKVGTIAGHLYCMGLAQLGPTDGLWTKLDQIGGGEYEASLLSGRRIRSTLKFLKQP